MQWAAISVSELRQSSYAILKNRIEAVRLQQNLQNGISGEISNINLGWPPVSVKQKMCVLSYKSSLTMKGKTGLLCSFI
jgi:hypothetical protein